MNIQINDRIIYKDWENNSNKEGKVIEICKVLSSVNKGYKDTLQYTLDGIERLNIIVRNEDILEVYRKVEE